MVYNDMMVDMICTDMMWMQCECNVYMCIYMQYECGYDCGFMVVDNMTVDLCNIDVDNMTVSMDAI